MPKLYIASVETELVWSVLRSIVSPPFAVAPHSGSGAQRQVELGISGASYAL